MSAVDAQPFPRLPLIGAGVLVGFAILVSAVGRYAHVAEAGPSLAAAPVARTIDLSFADQANGGVTVRNAVTGALVTVIQPNSGAFVRGVLRGLTRERMMHGLGRGPGFRLSQFDDGRLQIQDLADGRRIDLDAFGPTNRDAFMALLPPARRA